MTNNKVNDIYINKGGWLVVTMLWYIDHLEKKGSVY